MCTRLGKSWANKLVAQSGIQLSSAKTHRKLGRKFFLALQNAKLELQRHELPNIAAEAASSFRPYR